MKVILINIAGGDLPQNNVLNTVNFINSHKFLINHDLVKKWTRFLILKEKLIMKLPSYQFKKFPNSTANRLHKYNLMKHSHSFINETKLIISDQLTHFSLKQKKYITSWVNILRYNQRMREHAHDEEPDKILSGIIFLSKGSKLIFSEKNETIIPRAGLGILFPASWKHYVEPHNSFSKRISIAFDIRKNKKTSLWVSL